MEQHPVPQQISSYQFRLVGDMTLKQFFQLAGGALAALLVYASPLPPFFKWPLIALFILTGVALAFLPIEERPLEVWIIAFFRSIYSPTLYTWKGGADPNSYFMPEGAIQPAVATSLASTQPATPTHLENAPAVRLEENEKNMLSRVSNILNGHQVPVVQQQPEPVQTPPQVAQPKPNIVVPAAPVVAVPKQDAPQSTTTTVSQGQSVSVQPVAETLAATMTQSSAAATFTPGAAPPHPPTAPNLIVGQVMDAQGKIVEGAIIEIKDTQGRPVRALKTNKAGHFLIVTPLSNGVYELVAEKDGYDFQQVHFEANGGIIPSIMITAQRKEGK